MPRFELCSMLRFCVIVRYIRRGTPDAGFALFESESLKWPGFVEFDDVNGKVLTYSAQDRYVFYCSDIFAWGYNYVICQGFLMVILVFLFNPVAYTRYLT